MKNVFTLLFVLGATALFAQFEGDYQADNWSLSNTPACGDGSIDLGALPSAVTLWSSDNAGLGCPLGGTTTSWTTTIQACGVVSFDWFYTTHDRDGSFFDKFGYTLNGTFYQLTVDGMPKESSQSGSETVLVSAGDAFALTMYATDNQLGRGECTVSGFHATEAMTLTIEASAGTIYWGYDPAGCTTLHAVASGGEGALTYTWSRDDDPEDDAEYATICADGPDCIPVVLTVTDEAGCALTLTYLVEVIDVICQDANGIQKVQVCHSPNGKNPNTICVAPDAVPAHLAHGDMLGSCGEESGCNGAGRKALACEDKVLQATRANAAGMREQPGEVVNLASIRDGRMTINPNPVKDVLAIQIKRMPAGPVTLDLFSLTGQKVMGQALQYTEGQLISVSLPNLAKGQYFARLTWGDQTTLSGEFMIR